MNVQHCYICTLHVSLTAFPLGMGELVALLSGAVVVETKTQHSIIPSWFEATHKMLGCMVDLHRLEKTKTSRERGGC